MLKIMETKINCLGIVLCFLKTFIKTIFKNLDPEFLTVVICNSKVMGICLNLL